MAAHAPNQPTFQTAIQTGTLLLSVPTSLRRCLGFNFIGDSVGRVKARDLVGAIPRKFVVPSPQLQRVGLSFCIELQTHTQAGKSWGHAGGAPAADVGVLSVPPACFPLAIRC